jgi:hypothetical protein
MARRGRTDRGRTQLIGSSTRQMLPLLYTVLGILPAVVGKMPSGVLFSFPDSYRSRSIFICAVESL